MRRTTSLNHLPTDKDFIVGFDLIGNIKSLFSKAEEMPGCLFLLCIRGSCTVTIHLHKFEITKNCIAMIFPGQFSASLMLVPTAASLLPDLIESWRRTLCCLQEL